MNESKETLQSYEQLPEENLLSKIPFIDPTSHVVASNLGEWVKIGPNSSIVESDIGDYTYNAGDNQIIYATIGNYCSIASHVRINPGNHPTWRVTQHHMTYRKQMYQLGTDDADFFNWIRTHRVIIGHDVWIGHGVVIMPGITIGTGAVIGSGAVVTKSVQPYEVVVGIPAKPIKKRFSNDVIAKLLASEWWKWPREELEARFEELNNLELFLSKH